MAKNKVFDVINEQSKEFLLSKTAKILPNNPSQQGWSAERIKKTYYEGFIVLYEWLKQTQDDLNSVFDENGLYHVEMADKDGVGNNIFETYETKQKVEEIKQDLLSSLNQFIEEITNGTRIVGKAKADRSGNEIETTYIKTNRIAASKNDVDLEKVITLSIAKQLISDLVNGAGDSLDTLKELADALGNNANFSQTITTLLGEKLSIENAKIIYLSKEDAESNYAKAQNLTNLASEVTKLKTKHSEDIAKVEQEIVNLGVTNIATTEDINNLFQ